MIDAKMAHELKVWLMQLDISPNDCWENVECKVEDVPSPKHFNFHISQDTVSSSLSGDFFLFSPEVFHGTVLESLFIFFITSFAIEDLWMCWSSSVD